MTAAFKKILVPVDFSVNTEIAVKKALELIEPGESKIYLLHLQRNMSKLSRIGRIAFGRVTYSDERMINKMKLNLLESMLQQNHPETEIIKEFKRTDHVQNGIIEKALEINPDVIVIGKHSRHQLLPLLNSVVPSRIAKESGAPVLTIRPGALWTSTKTIVVPIGAKIPKRKIELIVALKKKFRITVHLVTVMPEKSLQNDFSAHALLNTYRFLRDIVQCPLGHEVLHGDNIARSIFNYAENINADMVLLDPDQEDKWGRYPERHISDELKADSRIQILTVKS